VALKIICDRCGRECVNVRGRLSLQRYEFTSQGEQVGQNEFSSLDLCEICTELARTGWGFRIEIEQRISEQPLVMAAGSDRRADGVADGGVHYP
jgi:hypothetical protein